MKFLSFGEILFDIIKGNPYLGGAPFNLAAHAAKLGAESYLASAVGNDPLGEKAIEAAKIHTVNTTMVNRAEQPTGVVQVDLGPSGSPVYTINENAAWDHIDIGTKALENLCQASFQYLCFGSLAQRSANNREMLKKILAKQCFGRKFFDINLRLNYYTEQIIADSFLAADIVKHNDEEVAAVSKLFGLTYKSVNDYAKWLIGEYNVEMLVLTLGADGAKVFDCQGAITVPGHKVVVADTVGAGDSFSAAFLVELHKTNDPEKAAMAGCKLGALVASKSGAVPNYGTNELLNFN